MSMRSANHSSGRGLEGPHVLSPSPEDRRTLSSTRSEEEAAPEPQTCRVSLRPAHSAAGSTQTHTYAHCARSGICVIGKSFFSVFFVLCSSPFRCFYFKLIYLVSFIDLWFTESRISLSTNANSNRVQRNLS